jgi:hypothetical protein
LPAGPGGGGLFGEPATGRRHRSCVSRIGWYVSTRTISLQSELFDVKNAPPSKEEIKAAIEAEVDQLARQGAPQLSVDGGKVSIIWPDVSQFSQNPGGVPVPPNGGASKLLCWLFRETMVKYFEQSIDQIEGGISQDERRSRIAELEAKILDLEHQEESLVVEALNQGHEVHRRPNASPYALLGIEPLPPAELIHMQAAE